MTATVAAREFELEPADNARLANLCGPLDENLRLVESRLDVEIRRRGDNFRVIGARAASCRGDSARAVRSRRQGASDAREDVHLALREREQDVQAARTAKPLRSG